MEAFFDLSLPKSWADLSDPQLLFFFRQLATDKPMAEIQTLCLCQWANILVRCRLYGSVYLVQHAKHQATLTLHQFVCAITVLGFLKSFPPYPIRIRTIGKAAAIAADFQGVPFSTFISTDNYYQGFLHTQNTDLLKDAATLLYPKVKRAHLTTAHCLSIFYWLASLKQYLARLFPHFLMPCAPTPTNLLGDTQTIADKVRHAMNAVSDISQGYIEVNNSPHTRRVKTIFLAMRHALGDMDARQSCMDTMRELFRQFMSKLILERTKLEQNNIYLDPRISFQEIDQYFFSSCACAYFQIAIDTFTDLRYDPTEWQ